MASPSERSRPSGWSHCRVDSPGHWFLRSDPPHRRHGDQALAAQISGRRSRLKGGGGRRRGSKVSTASGSVKTRRRTVGDMRQRPREPPGGELNSHAPGSARGNRMVKCAPRSISSHVRSPRCCRAMRRAIASPRPLPLEEPGVSRTKRSKIRSRSPPGIPEPSSSTLSGARLDTPREYCTGAGQGASVQTLSLVPTFTSRKPTITSETYG